MKTVSIDSLTVAYGPPADRRPVLENITLGLKAGETCAVIGPSGCGKSTLLKVLAGIIGDYEGTVAIDSRPLTPRGTKIGFIPQNYGLLPWKTVYQNAILGVTVGREATADDKQRLAALLGRMGLTGLENRYPGELSGGQQQRVALVRAFLLQPDLLLMDEPFSALDAITREELQDVFLQFWRAEPVATVLVTHQVEEAVYLGRQIAILTASPGRVRQIVDNPLFGAGEVRNGGRFASRCAAIREIVREAWQK